jgi:hypothetical protein
MKTLTDAGPAFPVTTDHGSAYSLPDALRDYFAAAEMQGILASIDAAQGHKIHVQTLDANCYDIADAMPAERAKTNGGAA